MKFTILTRLALFITAISLWPATSMATLPSDAPSSLANSAYDTDTTNTYIQDQVTEDINAINGFLCLVNAMAPSKMVNLGDYLALVDGNACFSGGSGSRSSDKDKNPFYIPMQVNSSRTSNTTPMYVKVWIDFQNYSVKLFGSASLGPSKTIPYGVLRVDGCLQDTSDSSDTCVDKVGYVDASRTGLEFYHYFKETSGSSAGSFNEFKLKLAATTTQNSGKGVLVKRDYDSTQPSSSTNPLTTPTTFAYSKEYFYRKEGTTAKCFDRDLTFAEESVWQYALYNSSTGALLDHTMGYPIEYIYSAGNTSGTGVVGTTYNGYISYYGINMQYGTTSQIQVPTGETVYRVNYNTNPPTKTPYSILRTDGKLVKHSSVTKTLSSLDKIPFRFYAYANAGTGPILTAGSTYEIYWDNSATAGNKFKVSGIQESSGYIRPYTTVVSLSETDMATAYPYGFGSWSDLLGGWFNLYPSTTPASVYGATDKVVIQSENIVYPDEFAAINSAGGLRCISNCPDSTTPTPTLLNQSWGPIAAGSIVSYTLDGTNGNLLYLGNRVRDTTSTTLYSGQMVTGDDFTAITSAKGCGGACSYYGSDLSLLTNPTYYTWQTSTNNWDQMSYLTSGSTIIKFYPPLPINFTVPNDTIFGNLQGKTIALQYGDYGSLWGIPNKCTDSRDNTACIFTGGSATPSANQHWAPIFSIPYSYTKGRVTVGSVGSTQGSIQTGDIFLVKPLSKEIRMPTTDMQLCEILGLTAPVTFTTLPSYSSWQNPVSKVGTKAPLSAATSAPRVIDGVRQY